MATTKTDAFNIDNLKEKDIKKDGHIRKGVYTGVTAFGVKNKYVTFVPTTDRYTANLFEKAAVSYVPNVDEKTFNVGDKCICGYIPKYRYSDKGVIAAITDKTVTVTRWSGRTVRLPLVKFMALNMGMFK